MQRETMKTISTRRESIIILNERGIIRWASSSINDLLGYLPDEIIGKEVFNLLCEVSSKKIKKMYEEIQKDPSVVNEGLKQFVGRNSEKIPIFVTLSNISGLPEMSGTLVQLRYFNKGENVSNISSLLDAIDIEIELRRKIEREIAAELHDHVGPGLAGVKLILDHSLKDKSGFHVQLQEVPALMADLIIDVRNLSHIINKRAVRDFQLFEVLNLLIEKISKVSVLRIVLKYDKNVEDLLENSQKVHIARIIQEQVMNVISHANAAKVLISVQCIHKKINVVTKDNGKGFESEKNRSGIGLSNMYYRANALGGNMYINSKCGEGTTIAISFPVK